MAQPDPSTRDSAPTGRTDTADPPAASNPRLPPAPAEPDADLVLCALSGRMVPRRFATRVRLGTGHRVWVAEAWFRDG